MPWGRAGNSGLRLDVQLTQGHIVIHNSAMPLAMVSSGFKSRLTISENNVSAQPSHLPSALSAV